jgi:hypothetical protein
LHTLLFFFLSLLLSFLLLLLFSPFLETGSCYTAQAYLKLKIPASGLNLFVFLRILKILILISIWIFPMYCRGREYRE